MNSELKDLTKGVPQGKGWGTKLDKEKGVPAEFSGASFHEIDHDEIESFFSLPNQKKFEYAYWAEHKAVKRNFIIGLTLGLFIGLVLLMLFASIL